MSNLIRKATLLAVGALLIAGAANAGAPSSAQSTKPTGLTIVATNGTFGTSGPDPLGNATFVIRDAVPNVVPNAAVTLDFSLCPFVRLCANQRADLTVDCTAKTVTGTTDGTGTITFSIVGNTDQGTLVANQNFPEPDPALPPPQTYFGCCKVTVTVPGFPAAVYPNLITACGDHEVLAAGISGGDLAVCVQDILSGNYPERGDYAVATGSNDEQHLNGVDLSKLVQIILAGGSSSSCKAGGTGAPCGGVN